MCEEYGGQRKTFLCSAVAHYLHAFTYLHGIVFSAVGEENDNFDECACVKRMETQDIEY